MSLSKNASMVEPRYASRNIANPVITNPVTTNPVLYDEDTLSFMQEFPHLVQHTYTFEDIIHVLKLLSKIQPHERLSTTLHGIHVQSANEHAASTKPITLPIHPSWTPLLPMPIPTPHVESVEPESSPSSTTLHMGSSPPTPSWYEWCHRTFRTPQGLRRWWDGDNRTLNIRMVRYVFLRAFALEEDFLITREHLLASCAPSSSSIPQPYSRQMSILLEANQQKIDRLKHAIETGIHGFCHLSVTYQEDPTALARIEQIVEMVEDRLILLRKNMDFLHTMPQAVPSPVQP